ncbi:MAG: hypothetical protein CMJ32_03735 [Phycisphaerae bacterium]|nr:hypothetical protein [Phycisphaerae bacterium]
MPLVLGCLSLFFPRLILFLVWLLSDYLPQGIVILVLGFIFLPLTTLAYAWAYNSGGGSISTMGVIVIVMAVLFDLGCFGSSARSSSGKPARS